jgi:hypothetical protein
VCGRERERILVESTGEGKRRGTHLEKGESMRAITCVLVVLVPLAAAAQITFERTYGGAASDVGRSAVQTVDGGYIVAGTTRSYGAGESDVYLIKTDASGQPSWTATFGGPAADGGRSIRETADGGYIIAGNTFSFGLGMSDIYLIKTDGDGHTVWTRQYGGPDSDGGRSVAQAADGGYAITGYTESSGAGASDVVLIRTNSNGDTLWTATYGGTSYEFGESIALTLDGGYVIAGATASFGMGSSDVYLVKTDSLGDTLWTRTYGGTDYDGGNSVVQTLDGGYIVVGETESFGLGGSNIYLVKTDDSGDTLWTRTYGGPYADGGNSIAQTLDGGYILTGYYEPFPTDIEDLLLMRIDSAGDTVWTRTYAGLAWDDGYSVAQTSDGGYIVAGSTWPPGAIESDVYLIKTDAGGVVEVRGDDEVTPPAPRTHLSSPSPNPFQGTTVITYALGERQPVSLTVYDIMGARVCELVSGTLPAGSHRVVWDGRDARGQRVASGIYFCRLEAGRSAETRRMVVLR